VQTINHGVRLLEDALPHFMKLSLITIASLTVTFDKAKKLLKNVKNSMHADAVFHAHRRMEPYQFQN
jgi:hypothetical protein